MKFFSTLILALSVALAAGLGHPCHAQAVPWSQLDIGSPGATGTYSYATGSPPSYSISGAGTGIGYTSDSLSFVSSSVCGNSEMETQVTSMSSSSATAAAGLMIRDSLVNSTIQSAGVAAIVVTPSSGVQFIYRPHAGAETVVSGPAVTAPIYLRLTYANGLVSGFSSADGISWSLVGSTSTVTMPNLYYEGFTTNGAAGTLNAAVYKYETLMCSVPQTGVGTNLLAWYRADAGLTTSGTSVTGWADQSGNGNTATSSGTSEPTLVTGAVNSGVLPTLSFNGTTQSMTLPTDFSNLTSGWSAFVVLEPSSSTATGNPVTIGNTANSDAVFPQQQGTKAALFAYNGTTSSSVTTSSGALSTSNYQLLEETFTPGASAGTGVGVIYVNGVQKATSSTLNQNLNNTARSANLIAAGIGGTNFFKGNISEILLYSAPLTSAQRGMLEAYAYGKYNVGNKPTLDAVVLSPQSSVVAPPQTVTMSQDQNATIFFTGDGSTPSSSSQWYGAAPVNVPNFQSASANSLTVNAVAIAPFFNNSSTASATYTVDPATTAISRNGLICWLRGDYATLVSGKVSSWSDVSGSGNAATQATAADRPTLSTGAINGLPALSFNGTSTFLKLPSGFSSMAASTCFIVTKPTGVTAGARFFDFGNGSASTDNLYLDEPTNTGVSLYTYAGTSGTSVTSSSAITLNQYQLLEYVNNGTGTATIFTNSVQGAQSTTMNTLSTLTRADNYIGQASAGGNYFKGFISELVLYNRALSQSERALVEGYLLQKYNALNANTTTAPVMSVAAGTLTAPTQVAIWSPAGSTCHFTTDGTAPSTSSPTYSTAINVNYTQTVKAMCVLNGVQSSTTSTAYTLNSTQFPAPSATDTTPLQIQMQLPKVSIPQDSNQH